MTENRGPGTDDRGQMTENRGPGTDDRGQRTENRGQMTEIGLPTSQFFHMRYAVFARN